MSIPDRLLTTSEILHRIRAILDQDIPDENKLVGIESSIKWNRRYHTRARVDIIREELHLRFGVSKTELREVDNEILPFLKSIEEQTAASTSPFKTFYYHYFPLYVLLRFHRGKSRPAAIRSIFAEAREKYHEALSSKKITLPDDRTAIQFYDKWVKMLRKKTDTTKTQHS